MTDYTERPQRRKSRSPLVGGVYFVRCGELIKIGTSTDVHQRVASIRTMTPLPVELVAIAAGSRAEESVLHARFAHLRQHGEWFTATPELLAYIAEGPAVAVDADLDERVDEADAEEWVSVSARLDGVAEIDRLAEAEDRDRSSMIRILLREAIAARKAKNR